MTTLRKLYELGGGSSHYVYRKGGQKLVVPHNRPFLKSVYVKKAIILLEGLNSEGDDSRG